MITPTITQQKSNTSDEIIIINEYPSYCFSSNCNFDYCKNKGFNFTAKCIMVIVFIYLLPIILYTFQVYIGFTMSSDSLHNYDNVKKFYIAEGIIGLLFMIWLLWFDFVVCCLKKDEENRLKQNVSSIMACYVNTLGFYIIGCTITNIVYLSLFGSNINTYICIISILIDHVLLFPPRIAYIIGKLGVREIK